MFLHNSVTFMFVFCLFSEHFLICYHTSKFDQLFVIILVQICFICIFNLQLPTNLKFIGEGVVVSKLKQKLCLLFLLRFCLSLLAVVGQEMQGKLKSPTWKMFLTLDSSFMVVLMVSWVTLSASANFS